MARQSWVQDPETGEFVPKEDYSLRQHARSTGFVVHGDIESYKSPIDGSIITSRTALREHMKRHNVVLMSDVEGEAREHYNHMKSIKEGTNKNERRNRIEAILRAEHQTGHKIGYPNR